MTRQPLGQRCGFCGYEFRPAEAVPACGGCPLTRNCRRIRCPRCGYEMLPEARLVTYLRGLSGRLRRPGHPEEQLSTEESLQ